MSKIRNLSVLGVLFTLLLGFAPTASADGWRGEGRYERPRHEEREWRREGREREWRREAWEREAQEREWRHHHVRNYIPIPWAPPPYGY